MPGNAFIKFTTQAGTDIPGESLQDGYLGKDGWIDVGDWSWDIEAETSFTKGTGAAVGKPTPGTFSFSHFYDKSSPTIMQMIVKGMHFKSVRLDVLKSTGGAKPELYFQLMAQNAFITKVSSKGGEDGAVNQDIEMVFKAVALGYKKQDNDGSLKSAAIPFNWDIAAMQATTDGITLTIK